MDKGKRSIDSPPNPKPHKKPKFTDAEEVKALGSSAENATSSSAKKNEKKKKKCANKRKEWFPIICSPNSKTIIYRNEANWSETMERDTDDPYDPAESDSDYSDCNAFGCVNCDSDLESSNSDGDASSEEESTDNDDEDSEEED